MGQTPTLEPRRRPTPTDPPAARPYHGDVATIEMLAARVGELETALKALIDECLTQDSRPPRPALQRADAVLFWRYQS